MNDASSRILAGLLETRTGQQLTLGRRWRIETALKSLMRAREITTLDQLVMALVSERDGRLADAVVEALLNNETSFFRDKTPFETLMKAPIERLRAARAATKTLSIWCAGCSTGQEAYSLAISFAEEKLRWQGWTINILGSDVSRSAIEQARQGLYSQFEVQRGLPVRQMIRWFDEVEASQWRVSEELRRSVCFEVGNLIEAPPAPIKFDVILCRNVLLYFPPEMRRKALDQLAQASASDAYLMLGAGETVIGQSEAFAVDPDNRGIYLKVRSEASAKRASRG